MPYCSTTWVRLTKLRTINNTIGTLWSLINGVQEVGPAFVPPGDFLSPLRDQPEPALLAAGGILPRGDGENIRTSDEPPLVSIYIGAIPLSEAR